MIRHLLLATALTCSTMVTAQTFKERAVDGANPPPPLANEFGPQAWIDDGLNYNSLIENRGTHTFGEEIAKGDVVGAFRMICMASNNLHTDDPVVYPNQPGKSHLHGFYGNDGVNAFSTYYTNRTTGESSCINRLNRSGYWHPALKDSNGDTRRPEYVSVYYKGYPKYRPQCDPSNALYVGRCVAIPHNLRMIFGWDMLSGTVPSGNRSFKCLYAPNPNDVSSLSQNNGSFDNIVDALASCKGFPGTAANWVLGAAVQAQGCWNGKDLDSANHRAHVADQIFDSADTARPACPKTHPYSIPFFTLQMFWKLDNTADFSGEWHAGKRGIWYFSSDRMPGMPEKKPGLTFHADYMEGWNEKAKKTFQDNCIDKGLDCSGGDLGDGTGMKADTKYPLTFAADPRIVKSPTMRNEAATLTIKAKP